MIQFDFIQQKYGFDLTGATNLIMTQGYLDPWSVGDIIVDKETALKRNIFQFSIDGAAHHLDLRQPNSCDPPSAFSNNKVSKSFSCHKRTLPNCQHS